MADCKTVKLGNKTYLLFEWKGYATSASLGDPACFREVAKRIKDMPHVEGIIFQKSYRKIFDANSFKILREYINTLEKMQETPELCDTDFEKFSIFKFKAQEDAIGAINYLKEQEFCEKDKKHLESLKKLFVKTEVWRLIEKHKELPESEMYHKIFRDRIIPGFITYHIESMDKNAKVIESYEIDGAEIKICELPGKPCPVYYVKPKELNISRKKLLMLNKAFEKLTKEEFDPKRSAAICMKVIDETAEDMSPEEKKELAQILRRYSFGYGIIEIILKDPKLQDVFIDSPGDKPIYIHHEDYEECATNIILTPEELEKLSTRFRMTSGRPFDESYPVLHTELKELGVRVAGVTEPITFSGVGFAFRKHAVKPWTLQHFIKNKMITAEAAGLLSFLIDNNQSMLVTGPRGSGKTSFLSAMIAEIPQNFRIITIEDTPELPIEKLRDLGYNIQHLRVRSTLQREAYEVTAEEALRNALRLGESVLIVGEVRGEEAKSLFEAMRIGAAGNVVLGTIHGSSAYDVWDRIVNDLNVPSTSFKATNFIVACSPIRKNEDIKRHRRVTGITEVLKFWREDPHAENGFFEVAKYNRTKDKLELSKLFKNSAALKEILTKRGMSVSDAVKSVKTRGKIKEEIVKASNKNPYLLSIEFSVAAVNKYHELAKNEGRKKVNYPRVLRDFKKWMKTEQKSFNKT